MNVDSALVEFLDSKGIGIGSVSLEPIGDDHSNLTYLLRRGETRAVLRRPPMGELAPSANDVLREARILVALHGSVPVPAILATCDDPAVIGAPFFIADFVEGAILGAELPEPFLAARDATEIAGRSIQVLANIHAVDLAKTGLDRVGRPDGYLERQLRRFGQLLESNATRPLPQLESLGRWLTENVPTASETTLPSAAPAGADWSLPRQVDFDANVQRGMADRKASAKSFRTRSCPGACPTPLFDAFVYTPETTKPA